jgi:predicted dehydrogenase/threonine dehydrogenase-like Zn-dependent dehydrogenase
MKQVTQHNRTGEIQVYNVPPPILKAGYVLVRTRYSVISAGTERASVASHQSSLLERTRKNPDLVKAVFEQLRQYGLVATYKRVQGRLNAVMAMGYSAAGTVVAKGIGVEEFNPGDRVACAGAGYANHAEYILVPKNLCTKVPEKITLEEAAYTTIGSIAMQGVRQATVTLGETVAVIGLGLIGQITVQLLKANGCAVAGIDLDEKAATLAKSSGADVVLHRQHDDVNKVVHAMTGGIGADAVIIAAAGKSNDPVRLAGEICRERGRVVLVGDVGLSLPRGPYYAKELEFRMSRSYGPGRYDPSYEEAGHDYPAGYVRWTENRNMQEFLRLLAECKVDVRKLTTHRFPVDDAKSAYELVSGKSDGGKRAVGVVLDYGESQRDATVQKELARDAVGTSPNSLNIGFIGAGSFAQSLLLPSLRSFAGANMTAVCNANGLTATNSARQFGFKLSTTDADEIFGNARIGTVFIATRHNLHASMVEAALKSGKNIFVEKPLALNEGELESIVQLYRKSAKKGRKVLLVGFNRRFAPFIVQAKEFFRNALEPFVIQYRINAGRLSRSHWTRDPLEGGGRIVGEVCHFVDLIQYLSCSKPTQVMAVPLGRHGYGSQDDDSVSITIRFENGSVGTINYLANGDSSVPKEHIEIFSTGRTAVIDNFKALYLYQQGAVKRFRRFAIDKGHKDEVHRFLSVVRDGGSSPIEFESIVTATRATFAIQRSLELGIPVQISERL